MLGKLLGKLYICLTIQNTMETSQVTTAIILDLRRKKMDGTYPLKLRVINERKSNVYPISIKLNDKITINSLTLVDYDKVKGLKSPEGTVFTYKHKDTYKDIKKKLTDKEEEAIEIIKRLDYFHFDKFREEFQREETKPAGEPNNVFFQYERYIEILELNDQLGTASNYSLSCKSIKRFIKAEKGKEPTRLDFRDVTVDFLKKYENFMYNEGKDEENGKSGKSATTVSMYLRALRTIFNTAIDARVIKPEIYPFRRSISEKKKYEIPTGHKVKKALGKEDLKKLFNAKPLTPGQEKAKDFWFFSYICNGMNIKDICLLRNENIESESLNFLRAKTRNTKKSQRPIIVPLIDYSKSVIEKYWSSDPNPKAFVFSVLNISDSEQARRKRIHAFTRFINQHIKLLAESVGVTKDISTYFARHSFATQAIQNGKGFEFVGEALNHSDLRTTKDYFAGFADDTKKDFMEGLMKF